MRILKVTQAYYPFLEKGGPAVKVRAIARGLAKRGHRVTVLTADLGLSARESSAETYRLGRWGWETAQDGVETFYLSPLAGYRTLTVNCGLGAFCRPRISAFDVVHIYGLYDLLGPGVARFCRRAGVPYLVEPMGMFRPIVRSVWRKRLYHFLLGRRLLDAARRLIATSELERTELMERGISGEKIVVRRNGIEIPDRLPEPGTFRRAYGIGSETKLVLFLGRLVAKKSPELILEAFAQWRQQSGGSQPAVLVLAGPAENDTCRDKLKRKVTQRGLNGTVLLTGPLFDEAKWAAFRDADLFVLPSRNENFGNAAAEAIACGTPVLITDCCGIAPLVDRRAGLVVPHDREAFEAGLKQLLGDSGIHSRFREGCREVARALSWEEPLGAMEALYQELATEGRAR